MEDTNFSLFNYVNEINNEIENLQEESVDIERKISAMSVEGITAEEDRKKIMADLEVIFFLDRLLKSLFVSPNSHPQLFFRLLYFSK